MPSGEIILSKVAAPDTPAAGKIALFAFSGAVPSLRTKDENGNIVILNPSINASVAQQAFIQTEAYILGSNVVLPAGQWRAGAHYRCRFDMTKTAACTSGPLINVKMGTSGLVGDATVLAIQFAAGTAAADTGVFEVMLTFRAVGVGTAAVIQAITMCNHHLAAGGLTTTGASGCGIIKSTSAGFDSTTQTNLGLSFTGGATGANFSGTCELVQARINNGQV